MINFLKGLKIRILYIYSMISLLIGVYLSVNWIPVSVEGLSKSQKQELLREGSINWELGVVFKVLALILFLGALVKSIIYILNEKR
jgi:hypothetical protein